MYVNNHSLVVLDAGAEVLPHYNVPVAAVLNQEVFRFEVQTRPGTRLTFSLSLLSIREAASSGFLSLSVTSRVEKTFVEISPFLYFIVYTSPSTPLKPYKSLTGQRANINHFSFLMMQQI